MKIYSYQKGGYHMIDKKAFKAYDIRGVYKEQLDENTAYNVGRAFVTFMNCKKVVVGRDMRTSSPSLFKELARGITDQGADVIFIGLCTTPMVSFTLCEHNYDCGIMVSASHNPGEYNAFKLVGKKGQQLSAKTGIDDIFELCLKGEFSEPEGKGNIIEKDVIKEYVQHHLSSSTFSNDLKVVLDFGNGVGSVSALPFLKEKGLETINLYPQPDGSFPNHPANPLEFENLVDVRKKVKEENADIGFAFDGDADRCLAIDENGEIIMPDLMLALFAEEELKDEKNKGSKVYYDLRFSNVVKEEVEKNGGVPVMMRVGNPFYKEKMINEGGLVAGELSAHIMFRENYNIDDGLFAMIKMLNILSKEGKKASELILPLKRYHGSPEINTKVKDADETLKIVEETFPDGKHVELDGVYVEYEDWWFNLRKSNTEPLVRLRVEANTEQKMEEMVEKIKEIIKSTI
jgi:phosphomannomutase